MRIVKNQGLNGGARRRLGRMVRLSAKRIFIRLGKQARHYVVEFQREQDIPRIGDTVMIGIEEWTVYDIEDTEILARIVRGPADRAPEPSGTAAIQTQEAGPKADS